ncbi:hypothetical protein EPI10_015438 [Gossypium australe]|uniref:Uncharacterized protein n=1 Tax=Gossypium australe TaxID=47621 RepID=A0A5B6VKZ0_9ROSI|nr:hypothetical protein EPI10_015438 [Gossypium australe]
MRNLNIFKEVLKKLIYYFPHSWKIKENGTKKSLSLNVNQPLIDLIEKVTKYTRYLKEIMSRRRKIKIGERATIDASCSAIISRQFPTKLKDPGSFTIPIKIREIHFMHPKGILEDVLVKVRSFIIPTNVIILDFEKDCEIPILLGKPFLATS